VRQVQKATAQIRASVGRSLRLFAMLLTACHYLAKKISRMSPIHNSGLAVMQINIQYNNALNSVFEMG
jgi:hypothetical protein